MKFSTAVLAAYIAFASAQRGNNNNNNNNGNNDDDDFVFDVSDYTPPCHEDADCESGVCDTDGENVNGDEDYYYCVEPTSCDIDDPPRVDGICNNMNEGRRLRGSTGHMQLRRLEDSFSGGDILGDVSPRTISDAIGEANGDMPNNFGGSTLLVYFGQFVDHDFTVIHMDADHITTIPGSGDVGDIDFEHSETIGADGNPPWLVNDETAWLDLTQVYSGDQIQNDLLRAFEGGELLSQFIDGDEFLPYVTDIDGEIEIAMSTLDFSFAAGDTRTNENVVLLCIHTLFMREHNRLAREFAADDASLSDEEVYQLAKAWNTAQYQHIVLEEFYPGWLSESLPDYDGYDDTETPDIDVFFSTAAFRFGHSVLEDLIRRIDSDGNEFPLQLGEAFFRSSMLLENDGIGSFLKGSATQCHERFDTRIVDGIRNMLFEEIPGNEFPALDLYSFNIARGRNHELASYPSLRAFFNLTVPTTFNAVTGGDDCITEILNDLYGNNNVDDCDPIICAFAEEASHGQLGDLLHAQLQDQFTRLRNADRFYYGNTATGGPGFSRAEINQIEDVWMHTILQRNTFINANTRSENYINNAFQSDECCSTAGNTARDTVCVEQRNGNVQSQTLAHCDAVEAVNAGTAFMAGSQDYDCDCNER